MQSAAFKHGHTTPTPFQATLSQDARRPTSPQVIRQGGTLWSWVRRWAPFALLPRNPDLEPVPVNGAIRIAHRKESPDIELKFIRLGTTMAVGAVGAVGAVVVGCAFAPAFDDAQDGLYFSRIMMRAGLFAAGVACTAAAIARPVADAAGALREDLEHHRQLLDLGTQRLAQRAQFQQELQVLADGILVLAAQGRIGIEASRKVLSSFRNGFPPEVLDREAREQITQLVDASLKALDRVGKSAPTLRARKMQVRRD